MFCDIFFWNLLFRNYMIENKYIFLENIVRFIKFQYIYIYIFENININFTCANKDPVQRYRQNKKEFEN